MNIARMHVVAFIYRNNNAYKHMQINVKVHMKLYVINS